MNATSARLRAITVAASIVAAAAVSVMALGTGQSFTALDPAFEQELYGTVQLPEDADGFAMILGGVAFASDGDVWASECVFSGTVLHRFDKQTLRPTVNSTSTLHPESAVSTQGGCGLTNHPDGFLYSNSELGVFRLDASTGRPSPDVPTPTPLGAPGNALGITVDPVSTHIVYVGADCHPQLVPGAPTCTVFDLNPATGVATIFAQFNKATTSISFVDGIYFDPTGQYLFMASRSADEGVNALSVVRRPTGLPMPDDTQLVQNVPMSREPDGVAFHAASPKFVVTLDEASGTMTRFDFPGDNYAAVPSETIFASGGFRGDLLQVGADGCIYATQGRVVLPTDFATRYDNGTTTTEDGIVRICAPGGGGFAPPPGTPSGGPTSGRLGDFVWNDLNSDGIQQAGEPGLAGVVVTLSNASGTTVATTTTSAAGLYEFANVTFGSYDVSAATPAGFVPSPSLIGNPATDSNGSPAHVTISAASPDDLTIDFGFRQPRGSIAGYAYKDFNRNGVRNTGEPGIGGVAITLSGSSSATMPTLGTGSYLFDNLLAGAYSVAAPSTTAGLTRSTPSPLAVPLAPAQVVTDVNFGYVSNQPPVCTVVEHPGTPFWGTMTYTAANGLKTLVITKNLNNNFAVTMPSFTPGTTAPVTITATLINSSKSAQLIAVGTDMFGNTVTCDPVATTLIRDRGREEPETFTDIPEAESWVTIENNDPGLRGLDIVVNGRTFHVRGLRDNETVEVSIASAMHHGNSNVITFIARGRPGGTADVTVSEPAHAVRRHHRR